MTRGEGEIVRAFAANLNSAFLAEDVRAGALLRDHVSTSYYEEEIDPFVVKLSTSTLSLFRSSVDSMRSSGSAEKRGFLYLLQSKLGGRVDEELLRPFIQEFVVNSMARYFVSSLLLHLASSIPEIDSSLSSSPSLALADDMTSSLSSIASSSTSFLLDDCLQSATSLLPPLPLSRSKGSVRDSLFPFSLRLVSALRSTFVSVALYETKPFLDTHLSLPKWSDFKEELEAILLFNARSSKRLSDSEPSYDTEASDSEDEEDTPSLSVEENPHVHMLEKDPKDEPDSDARKVRLKTGESDSESRSRARVKAEESGDESNRVSDVMRRELSDAMQDMNKGDLLSAFPGHKEACKKKQSDETTKICILDRVTEKESVDFLSGYVKDKPEPRRRAVRGGSEGLSTKKREEVSDAMEGMEKEKLLSAFPNQREACRKKKKVKECILDNMKESDSLAFLNSVLKRTDAEKTIYLEEGAEPVAKREKVKPVKSDLTSLARLRDSLPEGECDGRRKRADLVDCLSKIYDNVDAEVEKTRRRSPRRSR